MVVKFNLNQAIKPIIAEIEQARANESFIDRLIRVISQIFGYQMNDQELAAVKLYEKELTKTAPDADIREKIKAISTRVLFQSIIKEYDDNYVPPAPLEDDDAASEETLPFITEKATPPAPVALPPQTVVVQIKQERQDEPKKEVKKEPEFDPKKALLGANGLYAAYTLYYTYDGLSRIATAAASIGHSLRVLGLSAMYNAYNSGGQLRPLEATVTDSETLSWCMSELHGNAYSCSHPVFPLRTTLALTGGALALGGAYSAYKYFTGPAKPPQTA